ncbi:MAG TPA: CaiB/BaiF CoA-transferase family protein [Chryseolinea sp.]|nr:CaiB/BaiF CoA-transferase family protein [Chryseolinea sp.]
MFENLKVLELASVLAGPGVGQFFAELGATVLKVENPKTSGDVTRSWKAAGETTDDRSAYFCAVNWGKQSIVINLDSADGQRIVHKLVEQCDIVIASYKPNDAEKIGVDYQTMRKHNPSLIYGSITGYGPNEPRVGYDAVIQAEAGFMFLNGEPARASLKMPVALIDILAGHQLKEGILLALLRREKTGEGSLIEVSLFQSAIASLANQATNWLVGGKIPQKQGSTHPNIAPYGDVFKTAEGHEILLAVGNDRQFRDLCKLLDIQEIAADEKFKTNASRVNNRVVLHHVLQDKFAQQSSGPVLSQLNECKIPAGRIQNIQEVFETPQAKELVLNDGSISGVRTYIGAIDQKSGSHFPPPPHYGEHTVEVLQKWLKLDDQSIQKLVSNGIIA